MNDYRPNDIHSLALVDSTRGIDNYPVVDPDNNVERIGDSFGLWRFSAVMDSTHRFGIFLRGFQSD